MEDIRKPYFISRYKSLLIAMTRQLKYNADILAIFISGILFLLLPFIIGITWTKIFGSEDAGVWLLFILFPILWFFWIKIFFRITRTCFSRFWLMQLKRIFQKIENLIGIVNSKIELIQSINEIIEKIDEINELRWDLVRLDKKIQKSKSLRTNYWWLIANTIDWILTIISDLRSDLQIRLAEQQQTLEQAKSEVEQTIKGSTELKQVSELQQARLDRQIAQFEELQRVLVKG